MSFSRAPINGITKSTVPPLPIRVSVEVTSSGPGASSNDEFGSKTHTFCSSELVDRMRLWGVHEDEFLEVVDKLKNHFATSSATYNLTQDELARCRQAKQSNDASEVNRLFAENLGQVFFRTYADCIELSLQHTLTVDFQYSSVPDPEKAKKARHLLELIPTGSGENAKVQVFKDPKDLACEAEDCLSTVRRFLLANNSLIAEVRSGESGNDWPQQLRRQTASFNCSDYSIVVHLDSDWSTRKLRHNAQPLGDVDFNSIPVTSLPSFQLL